MGAGENGIDNPHFATESEAVVWESLRAQLLPGEFVLTGLRFTDVKYGDVEADMIVIFPDAGAVVLEVKGGNLAYENGEYRLESGRGSRRTNPFAQARKAKHALRRFLDRQAEWEQPLLRTEWMVALPFADVTGDVGPEGRRDLIIDRSELPGLRDLMRSRITSPLNSDPYPTGDWAETALTLLLRFKKESALGDPSVSRRGWTRGRVITVSSIAAVLVAGLVAFGLARLDSGDAPIPPAPAIQGQCNPNYLPCLPIEDDLDCPDIHAVVTVLKEDPYDLDRDGDGTACESFG